MKFSNLIGHQIVIIQRSNADPTTFTLLGVERWGLLVQNQQVTDYLLSKSHDQQSRPKNAVAFLPFSEIVTVIASSARDLPK
jgi:hypothetical protein